MKGGSMLKAFFVFIVIFLFTTPIFAQSVKTAWVRRYNGPGDGMDRPTAMSVDRTGNVYVTGISEGSGTYKDYATIKYYPDGKTAWVKRYNGPENDDDEALAMTVDGNSNVYVTGLSSGDYVTIKYYSNGDTAWVRRYNGQGNGTDVARAIAVDGSGNVYVTGESYGSETSSDYATIKYYADGKIGWVKRYNGPENDHDAASAIAIDNSGKVYVTGYSYVHYATIMYYPNGNRGWVRKYHGPNMGWNEAMEIAVDGSNNVYVTGACDCSERACDYATVKYAH
jgi:hypothetical protein